MNTDTKSQYRINIVALVCALLALGLQFWPRAGERPHIEQSVPASLYDSVLSAGKLRVGYTPYPPGCIKAPDGHLRGIAVDVLEEVGRRLGLKVEWTEEVGWATQIEGLKNHRYDLIGTAVWPNPKRARLTTLSKPLFYSPLYLYARSGDSRFPDGFSLGKLDAPDFRISSIEGATADTIIKGTFPKATRVTLPETADVAQSFLDVVGNKADLLITEPYNAKKFSAAEPGAIRNVLSNRPLRVFGNCYMFAPGETAFEHMLNTVIEDLHNSGFIDAKIREYEAEVGIENGFLRVAPGYILTE